MKKEFKVFKKNVTEALVTILSKNGEPFDRNAKIKKYKSLGYDVFDMSGNKI